MGALIATGVHRRVGGICNGVWVTVDNPPDYDEIDGAEVTISLGAVVFTPVSDVPRETSFTEGRADGTDNTWHYTTECTDA